MKKEIRKKVWEKCDYKCAYCGETLEYSKMQIDHITPKFKGGENKLKTNAKMKESIIENQLKHYLPYNLKCKILDYQSDYVGDQFETMKGYYILNNRPYFNFKKGRDYAGKNITQFKPILRSMSEFKHYFEKLYGCIEHQDVTNYFNIHYLNEHNIECVSDIQHLYAEHLPFGTLKVLLKHHFDVFDLIKKGVAINSFEIHQS